MTRIQRSILYFTRSSNDVQAVIDHILSLSDNDLLNELSDTARNLVEQMANSNFTFNEDMPGYGKPEVFRPVDYSEDYTSITNQGEGYNTK